MPWSPSRRRHAFEDFLGVQVDDNEHVEPHVVGRADKEEAESPDRVLDHGPPLVEVQRVARP